MVGESGVPPISNRGAGNEGCRALLVGSVSVAGLGVVGASAPSGGVAVCAGVKVELYSLATDGHSLDDAVTTGRCARGGLELQHVMFLCEARLGMRASRLAIAGTP